MTRSDESTETKYLSTNPEIYAALMEEIKQRSAAITTAVRAAHAGSANQNSYMHAEFAYLQLRYICELVALSSLAAHHSMGLGSKLNKAWNAGEAFSLLEQINPHCFPRSVRNIPDSRGINNFHVVETPTIFTRSDLAKIYGGCGTALHRGTIKEIATGNRKPYNLDDLNIWHKKIMLLLEQHMILIRDPDRTLLVNFNSDHGRVAVYSAEAVDPSELTPKERAALDD